MQDNTNSPSTTPKPQNSDSQQDEIFKINVVSTTGGSDDELNDEELNDIAGGLLNAMNCGTRTCSECKGKGGKTIRFR